MVAEMPRGVKNDLPKRIRPKSKIERWAEKGKIPKELLEKEFFNSRESYEKIDQWLIKHPKELGDFQRLFNKKQLEYRKQVARRSGDIRRLRILENGYEYYSLTQVLVRYGKNCHICLTPINLKASRRVGIGDWVLGLHIDHFIPISKGGPDTLENVRPSHAICNLKKGSSYRVLATPRPATPWLSVANPPLSWKTAFLLAMVSERAFCAEASPLKEASRSCCWET